MCEQTVLSPPEYAATSVWYELPGRSSGGVNLSNIEAPKIPENTDFPSLRRYLADEYLPSICDEIPYNCRNKVTSKIQAALPNALKELVKDQPGRKGRFTAVNGEGVDQLLSTLSDKMPIHEAFESEEKREKYNECKRNRGEPIRNFCNRWEGVYHQHSDPALLALGGSGCW
jgi:hypothetical protein